MATLRELIIKMSVDTAQVKRGMTEAESTVKRSAGAIIGAFAGVGAGITAAFSLTSLSVTLGQLGTLQAELYKTSERLNTSVETLSSFSVMALKSGMSTQQFANALTILETNTSKAVIANEQSTKTLGGISASSNTAAGAFRELGINANIFNKLPLDQKLMALSEGFIRNISPADQARIATTLFGQSNADLISVIREGPDAIQRMIDRAQELGISTTEMAKKAKDAKTAASEMGIAWEQFASSLINIVGPAIKTIINNLTDLIAKQGKVKGGFPIMLPRTGGEKAKILETLTGLFWGDTSETGKRRLTIPSGDWRKAMSPGGGTREPPLGGGKGGGDLGLDRMQSIIDTLQKDLSRLTEGSLGEIREWANHMRNEIEKVGRKGAETEEAMRLVATVESKKKEKATEDYYSFIAKESGDNYRQIEADAKDWLAKYKGFANAETNITAIKNRKIAEEDNRQLSERLGLQASLMNSIATEVPFLSQNLAIKAKMLPIEEEIAKLSLERAMASIKLSDAQKDELRGLLAIANAAKKYSHEREKSAREGIPGGLRIGSEQIKKSAETFSADTTAKLVASLPKEVSSLMASSFIGFLQGKAPDLQALGITMAQSIIQTLLEGILNMVIPAFIEGLAGGLGEVLESILGSLGGGGGGGGLGGLLSIFALHQGGMIEAHGGWPLRYDERIIKVQTGERVLSRSQNRNYESGIGDGGFGNAVININPRYPMSRQETEHMVRNKLMPALLKQQKRMGGRVP